MMNKSKYWRITLDPIVIEFSKAVSVEKLEHLLDAKRHPDTLGAAERVPLKRVPDGQGDPWVSANRRIKYAELDG